MLNKLFIRKTFFFTTLILLIFFIMMFIIKPGIVGYGVYQQIKSSNISIEDYGKKVQELESKILILDTNLSSAFFFNDKFSTELEKCLDKFFKCEENKLNFNISINSYEETIENLQDDLDEKNKEINYLQIQFNLFAENLANNLCCKAKIDNPNINSYILENNKIICLEQGILKISC